MPIEYPSVLLSTMERKKWNVSKYLLGKKYKNEDIANISYQLINIQDISAEKYKNNLRRIIFVFQKIWHFQRYDKKIYLLIDELNRLGILECEKDDKIALQVIKILLAYILSAVPVGKRAEAKKLLIEYSNKKGGNMVESLLDVLKEDGVKEGIQRGMQRGIQKGREEGMQETALKMKQKGLTPEFIQEVTGLATEQIEKL